jgi:hypothetical protein
MYDNKIRLSPDVLEKANLIAQQWGLKNARAAVEAVFRRYSDDYLLGRSSNGGLSSGAIAPPISPPPKRTASSAESEALNELNDLLGL